MTQGSESEKTEEKRLEEAKKWQAEAERSFAVAKAKEAHKLIEDAEKSRKRSTVLSICERLLEHAGRILGHTNTLLDRKSQFVDFEIGLTQKSYIESMMSIYESIRYDLMKTLEIKEEDMEKLFPKINPDYSGFFLTIFALFSVINQMHDMATYCRRVLR